MVFMKEAIRKLKDYQVKDKEEGFAIDLLIKKISQTNDSIEACISKAAKAAVKFYNDILGAENEN